MTIVPIPLAPVITASLLGWGTLASAAVVDIIDVDSLAPLGTNSTYSFTLGTLYTIEVTGTVLINTRTGLMADAEYYGFSGVGNLNDLAGNGTDIGIAIRGVSVDWGPYNDDHVYTYQSDGLEGIQNFSFVDSTFLAYSDNLGSLTVTVSTEDVAPVPLPAGLPLLLLGLGGLSALRIRKTI